MEDRFEKEHFEVEFILFYFPSTYFYVYLLTGFSPDFVSGFSLLRSTPLPFLYFSIYPKLTTQSILWV